MLILSIFVVFCATFLLAVIAVLIASAWFERRNEAAGITVAEIENEFPGLLKEENLSSISVWSRILESFDFSDKVKRQIEQAGLDISVGRLSAMTLLIGTFSLAVLTGIRVPFFFSVLLATPLALIPYLWVLRARRKRLDLFEDQFPDGLDFLARALRAGHPFSAALELLANEDTQPLSGEMRIAADERRLGMSWDEALNNLSRRIPSLNLRLFAAAVILQTRTGGKLSEVLGQLAETMREAASLRGEVRAIAAHGRITGAVLTVLPLGIAIMMMMVNPDFLLILMVHPIGKYLVVAAIACLIAAHFVIRRIVDIRV